MKEKVLKIIFLPLVLLYMNSVVLCFFIQDLTKVSKLLPIIVLDIILGIDIIIRNRSKKEDRYNRIIVIAAFLIFPILVAAPYIESRLLFGKGDILNIVIAVGILLEAIGGFILIYSRISIGKYGTTSIALEENHILITTGIYKYSRNPIYFGMIVLFVGYGISLYGFISTGFLGAFIWSICLSRIKLEEKVLEEAFGSNYLEYKKKTKCLIPFIY